jgi:hypothetical protein
MAKKSIYDNTDILPINAIIRAKINADLQNWKYLPQQFEDEKSYNEAKEKFRIRVIRNVFREADLAFKKSKSIFYDELSVSERELPYQWMLKDKLIHKVITRTHISPILNHIYRSCTLDLTRSLQSYIPNQGYLREEPTNKGYIENRELILFNVDYAKMSDELDLVTSVIQRYLNRFTSLHFLEKLTDGRGRAKHPTIYAAGTWPVNHSRRIYFLKRTPECIAKLRAFKAL